MFIKAIIIITAQKTWEHQNIQNLKIKHYHENQYVYNSAILWKQEYKHSTTDNPYTPKPKTENTLLLKFYTNTEDQPIQRTKIK